MEGTRFHDPSLQHALQVQGALRDRPAGQGGHLPVRAHGLQAESHRPHGGAGDLRHDQAVSELLGLPGDLGDQRNRRGRQADRGVRGPGPSHGPVGRGDDRRLHGEHRGAGRRLGGPFSAGHGAHGRHHRVHRRSDRQGLCLRVGGGRLLRHHQGEGLRQAEPPDARFHAGRGRDDRRAQAQRGRLCVMEGGQAGRALVAEPVGAGPPGVAHRMLGDERPAVGRDVRHPRRRPGPGLSAPRERDRPERGPPRQAHGPLLAPQWPDAGLRGGGQGGRAPHASGRGRQGGPGERQDQQVARIEPLPRDARRFSARDDPLLPPLHPLPPADRLQRRPHPRGGGRTGDLLQVPQALRAGDGRELLRNRRARQSQERRAGSRRRSAADGSVRAPRAVPRGHGRRLQHGRGGGHPLRPRAPAEQVC